MECLAHSIVVRNSRRLIVGNAISVAMLVALGLLAFGLRSFHVLLGLVFLVLLLPIAVWRWLDRRPQITINAWGIGGRRVPGNGVQWAQIRHVYLKSAGGLQCLFLELYKSPEIICPPVRDVSIRLDNLEISPQELHQLVQQQWLERSRGIIEPAAMQLTLDQRCGGRIHTTSAVQRFGAGQVQ